MKVASSLIMCGGLSWVAGEGGVVESSIGQHLWADTFFEFLDLILYVG